MKTKPVNLADISLALFESYRRTDFEEKSKTADIFYQSDNISTIKEKGKNKGQYGYYANHNVETIAQQCVDNNITSICDLGSGVGIFLFLLSFIRKTNDRSVITKYKGYDNEKKFVEDGNNMFFNRYGWKSESRNNLELKDILTLKEEDIKDYDAVYFWEPLHDYKLCKKFVKNLGNILKDGQYVLYVQSGEIGNFIRKDERFIPVSSSRDYRGAQVFKFKKNKDVKRVTKKSTAKSM